MKTVSGSIVLGYPVACIPGFRYIFHARPPWLFAPLDITMSDQTGSNFMIRELRIGPNSQLSYEEWVRGGIEASSLRDRVLPFITPAEDLVMEVENVSEVPTIFSITITGLHAE